ncbi:hypothetical protein BD324DRAFT_638279 [Kockovaella imperatae]|uniref:Beta-lactamase-like protein n=1 Tax=Kockovaella imperatae TaxID=4999 RepID=A0A1Y1UAH3_9TREE|nr:hypothetical protein BD324DRAFT_638279 [Kockovaella imperatae]ORX34075.1 hypothetical protein BD324DRAFT_638279 [Kockovaella imperatae]
MSTPISIPDISKSTDSTDKELVIRQVTPDIVTFSKPFSRFGMIAIGGRSTAIRLPSTDIFIYVSTPHSPATAETIRNMGGEVKWLVTPDGEHGMYIEEYTKAYPKAQPIGVERFAKSKPQIQWAGLFGAGGETKQYGFEPHITLLQFTAHPNHELMAVHHPSKTLIQGDMLFNLPPKEQYSRVGMPFFVKTAGHKMSPEEHFHASTISKLVKDKALAKRELEPINKLEWDRIIPCHGDVIETGGKEAWAKVFNQFE